VDGTPSSCHSHDGSGTKIVRGIEREARTGGWAKKRGVNEVGRPLKINDGRVT